jgi:hypothetical protein
MSVVVRLSLNPTRFLPLLPSMSVIHLVCVGCGSAKPPATNVEEEPNLAHQDEAQGSLARRVGSIGFGGSNPPSVRHNEKGELG